MDEIVSQTRDDFSDLLSQRKSLNSKLDRADTHEQNGRAANRKSTIGSVRFQIVLERAKCHEQLCCPELAVGDAFVVYLLLTKEISRLRRNERRDERSRVDDESTDDHTDTVNSTESNYKEVDEGEENQDSENDVSDDDEEEEDDEEELTTLQPIWEHHTSPTIEKAMRLKLEALKLLHRCAVALGCGEDANRWLTEVKALHGQLEADSNESAVRELVNDVDRLNFQQREKDHDQSELDSKTTKKLLTRTEYGHSHRLIYPWNTYEPDRTALDTLKEINTMLAQVAPHLEAKECSLPVLCNSTDSRQPKDNKSELNGEISIQLGLVAKDDLAPGINILREKSILTAIRPRDGALCDACAQDLESVPFEQRRECEGDECDVVYCSEECQDLARTKYHRPRIEEDGEVSSDNEDNQNGISSTTPFCGDVFIHSIGRIEDTCSPEWDLYFLLLTRTIQIAETQGLHPLDLPEIKYIWGDFSPPSPPPGFHSLRSLPKILPFSLRHHIELPLQWFEELMLSLPDSATPYSSNWLEKYDWWVIQTLFAKFRGVANAQQSTWSGKPEIAAVHPLWCLANHSCNPNVEWQPSGVRSFTVRSDMIWSEDRSQVRANALGEGGHIKQDKGIRKGEQIWSHYTDVAEKDYRQRRARLQEVLGGDCLCERCLIEERSAQDSCHD